MPTISKEFGKRLRKAIESSGISQRQFALRTGISPSGLTHYLNGRLPDAFIFKKIADALNISMVWLLTGKEEKEEPLSLEEKQIIDILRKYPKNMQPNILKTFNVLLTNYFEKYIKTPKERRVGEVERLQEIIKLLSIRK